MSGFNMNASNDHEGTSINLNQDPNINSGEGNKSSFIRVRPGN